MKARLFCKTGILSGKAIDIREAAIIGKSADSDLELDAQFISNRHARIYFDKNENCYFLEDLRSRNGTKLDGLKVTQKEKLGKLHVVTFAENFDFIFQVVDDDAQKIQDRERSQKPARGREAILAQRSEREKLPDQAEAPSIGRTILDDAAFAKMPDLEKSTANDLQSQESAGAPVIAGAGNKTQAPPTVYFLEFKITGKEKQSIRLNHGENVVGRSSDCAIFIDDPSMSRRQAVLIVKSGSVMVRDLGSKNHTFIDKKAIATEVEVRSESKLQFGAVEARVVRKT